MKERDKKMKKRENGITLIAVIITVIIMLILAVISYSNLTQKKIIENAEMAKEVYQNSAQKEENDFIDYDNHMNYWIAQNTGKGQEGLDISLLQNFKELNYTNINCGESQEYIIEKKYPLVIIAVHAIGDWSGQYAANTKLEISNAGEKELITLTSNTRLAYADGRYGNSMTLGYMVEPEVGTIVKASIMYYGKLCIYALGEGSDASTNE